MPRKRKSSSSPPPEPQPASAEQEKPLGPVDARAGYSNFPMETATRRRVLVVDDNTDHAESLSFLLKLMGHDTRLAHDGEAALQVAAEFEPDVALIDIGLPRLNGYEVARRLRAEPRLRSAVLVAQTGWGQESDRARSQEAGFDHHLIKPVAPEVLADIIDSADGP